MMTYGKGTRSPFNAQNLNSGRGMQSGFPTFQISKIPKFGHVFRWADGE